MSNDYEEFVDEERLLEDLLEEEAFREDATDEIPDEDDLDNKPTLDEVARALQTDDGKRPNPVIVYGLSELSRDEVAQLDLAWHDVPVSRQRQTMRYLVEAGEVNFQLSYRSFGLARLSDHDPRVRETAVELLWEDQSLELMNELIEMARHDPNRDVRAGAMIGLGRFILAGELGDLPSADTQSAINLAVALWQDETTDLEVRRRALEAVANCSHDIVPQAIRDGYASPYPEMRQSAIFAMGRSYDKRWRETVLEEIESDDPAMRYEAARAAGELEMDEAVPHLARLLVEPDREIVETAVWSLGEIGGRSAVRALEAIAQKAEEDGDTALYDAIEDALGNAMLASELSDLDLLDS
jgi:hypothetical protein